MLKHKGYRYGFSTYALIWNQDFYYAVGWSEKHGKLAQFRVDRMTAIQDSDAPYISDPSFDPASYIREIFGMYHDVPQRVTLLCENRTMRNIIDHFGEDVDTGVVDANHFRATVDVAPTPPFFSWVFTFCGWLSTNESIEETMAEDEAQGVRPESIAAVEALLQSADQAVYYNEDVTNIVLEETAPFFDGAISQDEAIGRIQERVGLYLDEQ